MSVIKLIEYYNRTEINQKLLGFSDDDLRLLYYQMPNPDFKSDFSKIIHIAEGLAMHFENNMDAYYYFIKEYIFRHCNEIFQIQSAVEMLGIKSTIKNLFYYLSDGESIMGIANYINSKSLEYFVPNCFMKKKKEIITEYPSMIRFFDAFKPENKVVVTKDEFLLSTYNYLTEKNSRDLRNFEFDTIKDMQKKSQDEDIQRKDTDLDIIVTPPVFNAFIYEEYCEGHLYARKDDTTDGYYISDIICKCKWDGEQLIKQLLKSFPFSSFIYLGNDKNTIEIITRHGFLKKRNGYMRSALKTIEYPDYYSPISKLEPIMVCTEKDIKDKVFVYGNIVCNIRLDIYGAPFENVLSCKYNGVNKIIGIDVKQYYFMDNCRYIVYQNYCSKTDCYECFDIKTGKISNFKMFQYNDDNKYRETNDIAFARKHSIETGYIVSKLNHRLFIPCLTFRENCMYLPYNVPEDAMTSVGFNVITQTVIVYNNSLSEGKVKSVLNQTGFGDNIKFVDTAENIYCKKYGENQIIKTKNNWCNKLKKLDNAYRFLLNRPFELLNEFPVPSIESWLVSGNLFTYKALTEYLKRHEMGFNLLYIFSSVEFYKLMRETPSLKLDKKIENTHIVLEGIFNFGYSVKKIKQFYENNRSFFYKIYDVNIELRNVGEILAYICKSEYLDIDKAVNYLMPNVLLFKSQMPFDISDNDELNYMFKELVGLNTDD